MNACSHAATVGDTSPIDEVMQYDEGDLHPIGDPPDAVHGMELVTSLYEAASADERERAVRSELAAIGFDWLEYSRIRWHDGGIQPLSFLRSYVPPEWTAAYCRDRSWEVDDRLQGTPCNGVPRLWTVDEVDRAARLPEHRASRSMLDRLVSCGVGSGMTIVLPMPLSDQGAALHLLSRGDTLRWATKEALAAGLLLGVCLNEFITKYTAPLAVRCTGATLSALQTRIAQCIARGETDKEVARSMAMSSHAVDYHLRALRRKLNVRNRVQLAQAIGRIGIAQPA